MASNDSREAAARIFGRVAKAKPNKNQVRKKNQSDAICIFCSGCGTCYELDLKAAKRFARRNSIIFTQKNVGDYFLEVGGCESCGGDKSQVKLTKISGLG